MKKQLLKSMLLLCALVAGSSNVWADVTDELTATNFAAASTTYTNFSGVNGTSGAVYAGNSAKTSSGGIQMRSKNSNSGIVSTTSGGKLKSIKITVESGTNTIDVYGSNTAYESASDLYDSSKQGQKLGSLSATGTITVNEDIEYVGIRSYSGAIFLTKVEIVWGTASLVAAPTFTPAQGTYTSAQSVELSCETDGASIYYTMGENPADPTSSSTPYTGAITVDATKTIKAIAIKGDDASSIATANYTIVSFAHAGTELDPYDVADAYTAIDNLVNVTEVYATGIVSEIVTAYNSTYENITFNISTDGTTASDQLQAYRCKGATGIDASEVQVGDIVVIKGNLTKHSDIYEFAEACEIVSIDHPVVPTIVATPSSLAGFTYVAGNGPSDAQTFSVSGTNLTANISLSLEESSNYEISLSEGSGYTNTLSLTQTAGTIDATTIYVRLKENLAVESYDGTITLTSTDATNKTISLTGNVTAPEGPNFTWDLSTDNTTTATDTKMSWIRTYASMVVNKGSSTTNTNNYYPGTTSQSYSSTRFYKNSNFAITPAYGCSISSVVFTATTVGYANALKGSTWTNATASVDDVTVTVTPTNGTETISAAIGGTCGFTAVKVYYEILTTVPVKITAAGWASFSSLSEVKIPAGVTAYYAAEKDASTVTLKEITGGYIPANTGVVVAGTEGTYTANVTETGATLSGTNLLKPWTTEGEPTDGKYYTLAVDGSNNPVFKLSTGGTLAAGKAYLVLPAGGARELSVSFGGETTGIDEVRGQKEDVRGEYFNLAGQRVAQPTRGLYIVNGKKVVIK